MRPDNPIGNIIKGGLHSRYFDIAGLPIMWTVKAKEMHRMVELGLEAWKSDISSIKAFRRGGPAYTHPPSTLTVSLFLAALAIENLLKALLVREHPDYIKDGKLRGKVISSHNLLEIAADANFDLSENEQDFCELGTECILVFGRYHIAKNVSSHPTTIEVKESAFKVYESLYNRLQKNIEDKPFSTGSV